MRLNPPPVSGLNREQSTWFQALYKRVGEGDGDAIKFFDRAWVPTTSGVALTGNVTITGRYWLIGSMLNFQVNIKPDSGTTSTVAGAKITNLPEIAKTLGCATVVDGAGSLLGACAIPEGGRELMLPVWVTNPHSIVIQGAIEI